MTKPMTNEERAEWLVKYWDITDSGKRLIYKDDILKHLNAACEQVKAEAVKAERERVRGIVANYFQGIFGQDYVEVMGWIQIEMEIDGKKLKAIEGGE